MNEMIIPLTNSLITIILSLPLLISITLSTHFSVNIIFTPIKPIRFPIHNSLYCVTLPLIIISDLLLNLSLVHKICLLNYVPTSLQSFLTVLWEAPKFTPEIQNLEEKSESRFKLKVWNDVNLILQEIWSDLHRDRGDWKKNLVSFIFTLIPFSFFNKKDISIECIGLYYRLYLNLRSYRFKNKTYKNNYNICLFLETNGLQELSTHRQKYTSYPYILPLWMKGLIITIFRIYNFQVLKRLCYNTICLLQI